MKPGSTRQKQLCFEETSTEYVPSEVQKRAVELLAQLLGEIVAANPNHRRNDDERKD